MQIQHQPASASEAYRTQSAQNESGASDPLQKLTAELQEYLKQLISKLGDQVAKAVPPAEPAGGGGAPKAGSPGGGAAPSPTAAAPTGAAPPARSTPDVSQPTGAHGVEMGMKDYKDKLNDSMDRQGITDPQRRSEILGFAMMEGAKEKDLDRSKDGTASANGPLNINETVLRLAGEQGDSNTLSKQVPGLSLDQAVGYLNKAADNAGIEDLKRAQRGGQTTLEDGKSYDYGSFSQNFDYTVGQINKDPSLKSDDRRVWTQTGYV